MIIWSRIGARWRKISFIWLCWSSTVKIGLIFTAFLASSKKGPIPAEQTSVKITIASPAPVSDSQLEEAKKEVTVFTGSLSSLDSELDTIKFPQLDLDIKF